MPSNVTRLLPLLSVIAFVGVLDVVLAALEGRELPPALFTTHT